MATYKSIKYIVPAEVVEHTDSINALADVDTSTVAPEVGQTLKWIGNSKWKPRDIDSTNQSPTISSPGVATIIESVVTGRAVATILSSDPENDALIFSITAGNTGNAFTINSSTGAITTAAELDYETTNSYTLTIDAYDVAGNGAATTQIINVTDNSNPVISNTSSVSLLETVSIGTAVSTISASDLENDTITYSITAGNINNKFTINSSTGAITTAAELDYEITPSYTLTITASDSVGEIGTATQTVNVTDVVESIPNATGKAIFGFGNSTSSTETNITNLVSTAGVVASDTTSVGTARRGLAATGYGGDKAIFGFGVVSGESYPPAATTNLVSNTGVVATDTASVSGVSGRTNLAAAEYGNDRAIFAYGQASGHPAYFSNLVNNSGVVATDTTGVGMERRYLAASGYGGDKAILGFGEHDTGSPYRTNVTNLVSNIGVIASDTTGVGTAKIRLAAAGYGSTGQAIFGFGSASGYYSTTNLVSNTGVVATDTTGVGTARSTLAAASYGGDKALFGFGAYYSGATIYNNVTNLVSNTGVVSSDQTGVGTGRESLAAAGF
tara:strand:+ start:1005 stop:2681 length:1677 start_codon:yes stop_codon:yes gene_type:complete